MRRIAALIVANLGCATVRGPEETALYYSEDGAIDCGVNERPFDREGRLRQWECVQEAQRTGRPFRVVQYEQGIDSILAMVFVSTKDGKLRSFDYDSDISGGSGPSRTTELPCSSISSDKNGNLKCSQ
ncbi:MAG: hypothetical protein HYV07_07360 [Deltaproteobacteria bacterium]|nr:hypothetical protein [Deltaproteobacteria bacterium]